VQLDVTDGSSIAAAKTYIETTFSRLDILVNNAAIYFLTPCVNLDILRTSFETNLVGVAAVTDSFPTLLRRSTTPCLILVSSSNGSLTYNSDPDCPHGGTYASEYRITKAALNMLLVQYHASLKDVTVLGVDPGFCATKAIGDADALRRQGAAEPEVGGAVVGRVVRGEEGVPGRVVGPQGVLPW
jgi:NAD(P)-dependent dehydrogenase (short-subunit alcohol dehydrogenase family)